MKKIHMILSLGITLLASTTAFASSGPFTQYFAPPVGQIDYFNGYLDDGASRIHDVTLYRGIKYEVKVDCDRACEDLGLEFYDSRGNLFASKHFYSISTILTFRVNTTGQFRMKVIMGNCYSQPCSYNIGVGAP